MTTETQQPKALSILRTIQAENLLVGQPILTMLQGIRGMMSYKEKPFADYFDEIQDHVAGLGRMQLRSDVDPMSASSYLVDLTMGYERTLDDINRVSVEATAFLGRLKVVHNKVVTLKTPFMVLWSIGAADEMKGHGSWKISATDMKAIAASEFTFLVNEADMELAAMIEAMDLTLDNLKGLRKLAQDKYSMGKDQVNAALSGLDFDDRGIAPGAPRSHKPAENGTATMKGMFGDRVQEGLEASVGAPALEAGEDDFPHEAQDLDALDEPVGLSDPTQVDKTFQATVAALTEMAKGSPEPEPADVPPSVLANAQAEAETAHLAAVGKALAAEAGKIPVASEGEEEHFQTMEKRQEAQGVDLESAGVTPETPVATPEGFVPAKDLQVGDKVLVADGKGETSTVLVTSSPELPVLEKPGKGKPVVVPYAVNVAKPGHTPNVPGLLFGIGKTKLELTAQANPAENGVYRWHGPEAALTRIEEKAPDAPGPDTAPKPPKLVAPDATAQVEPPVEPRHAEKPQPQVVAPDVKTTIQDDPFISQAQKTELIAKIDEEDDFPAIAGIREEAFEGTGETVITASLDDDDFPTSAPEPPPAADDDDDFPVGAEIIDRTPKPEDAPETPALEEKAPEAPKLESPATPEKPKAEAPKPDAAVVVPKPGGLFRSRTLPPNQTAAPTFRPSKPVEGAQVTGDGLDEVL